MAPVGRARPKEHTATIGGAATNGLPSAIASTRNHAIPQYLNAENFKRPDGRDRTPVFPQRIKERRSRHSIVVLGASRGIEYSKHNQMRWGVFMSFKVFSEPRMPWPDAEKFCEEQGGNLADVTSDNKPELNSSFE